MKKWYAYVLLFVLSSLLNMTGFMYAQDHDFPYIGIVQTEKLRVMPHRGTNYREITELSQNDLVTVLNKVGDWFLIKPPETITCWMSSQFIEDGKITGSNVNVRQGPGLNFPVVCQVSKDDEVTVLQQNDAWSQIAPPDAIQAWVNADFVAYFSSMDSLSATLERMEASKEDFNQAVLYSKSQLTKDDPRSINFAEINEKFYEIIERYPDTIYAQKALFELESIEQKRKKIEEELEARERQAKVKELFALADDFASRELEKRDANDIDESQIKYRYMEIVKEFPEKEEAKWSIERMAMIRNKIQTAKEEAAQERQQAFEEAEEFRNQELLKELSEIDFSAIKGKYRSIIVLYPDTPEAKRAQDRIDDLKQRESYAKFKTAPAEETASNLYAYEGYLVLEEETRTGQNLYKIEQRGFLSRTNLCYFASSDPNIQNYLNEKVKVEGTILSLNENDIPIIDVKRIQLR